MLYALADFWRESGMEVTFGPDFSVDADVAILHHNLSRLDPAGIPTAPDGVPVLNGKVYDISKRLYSELILSPSDDWAGPVIVKTNDNHFGIPDQRTAGQKWWAGLQQRLSKRNWKLARQLPYRQYPILQDIGEVPAWVWRRDDLLVERFLPEREGDLYAIRGWVFLGSAGYGYRLYSKDPAVKVNKLIKHDYIDEAPPELMTIRERMGFDYGKFDYVVHDGRAILFDANKTPTFGGDARSKRLKAVADAIEEFMP